MNAKEIAKRTVEQWDNFDRFRVVYSDGSDEPSGVTVARELLRLEELSVDLLLALEEVLEDGLKTKMKSWIDKAKAAIKKARDE